MHGFLPYLYIEAPTRDFGPEDCESLRCTLNVSCTCVACDLLLACERFLQRTSQRWVRYNAGSMLRTNAMHCPAPDNPRKTRVSCCHAVAAHGQVQGACVALLPVREGRAKADAEVLPADSNPPLPEDHGGLAHHDSRAQMCACLLQLAPILHGMASRVSVEAQQTAAASLKGLAIIDCS